LSPLINENDNTQLIRIPDIYEVKNALFSIDSAKTLFPNGFGAGFFKQYWNFTKKDLLNCILEFFKNGKILKEINYTFITLIPKANAPTQIRQFRPISSCLTVYKIISKILVNRLRSLLDKIISPMQSTFIPGRSTHDNILLRHEIMHKFRTKIGKTAWTAIKLGMEKAYDRLEWDFICKCFQELRFHSAWIKWIMEAISMVNDIPSGLIIPSRRIRQGDPLSSYIFIICMEVLTESFIREATTHMLGLVLKSVHNRQLFRVYSLLFADDCLLFSVKYNKEVAHD